MKNKSVTFLTQAAMIAAIYVVLTMIFAPFSFGEVQVRVAEALTILPIFTPAAIPGLFVGCLIGNITGGAVLPDIIFGSIATLIGAVGTYQLRKCHRIIALFYTRFRHSRFCIQTSQFVSPTLCIFSVFIFL